jgi:hypothetical protein
MLCFAAAIVGFPSIAAANSRVIRTVGPDGKPFYNGIRCGGATAVTGDIFPNLPHTDSNGTMIFRISKVLNSRGTTVGWIFYGTRGNLLETTPLRMSAADAKWLGVVPSHGFQIVGLSRALPADLRSRPCADASIAPVDGYIDNSKL